MISSMRVPSWPRLSYTVKPMSYILWPPLAVQNKRDFRHAALEFAADTDRRAPLWEAPSLFYQKRINFPIYIYLYTHTRTYMCIQVLQILDISMRFVFPESLPLAWGTDVQKDEHPEFLHSNSRRLRAAASWPAKKNYPTTMQNRKSYFWSNNQPFNPFTISTIQDLHG